MFFFFFLFFLLAWPGTQNMRCHPLAIHIFYGKQPKHMQALKKNLQKTPTALLLDVSRNTQYFFFSLQRISLTLIVVVPTRGLVMDKQIMQHQQLLDTHHKMSMNFHLTHFNRKKTTCQSWMFSEGIGNQFKSSKIEEIDLCCHPLRKKTV